MSTFKPMGARLLVDEIITTLSIEERGKRAGITVIVEDDNRPRATMGRVIAIGTDPIFKETGVKVGDIVHFGPHSGYVTTIEDHDFRMIEWQEITALEQEEQKEPNPEPPTDPNHSTDQPSPELSPVSRD